MTDHPLINNKKYPSRKSHRLPEYDYSNTGYYFVTICIRDRKCILGNITNDTVQLNDAGKIIEDMWQELPVRFLNIELGEFVVMPNHIHGIIMIMDQIKDVGATSGRPRTRSITLGSIMGYFKHQSAKRINILHNTLGRSLWQRSFYDHVIRNDMDLLRVQEYISNNPLQWSLDEENPDHKKGRPEVAPTHIMNILSADHP